MKNERTHKLWPGINCRLEKSPRGIIVTGSDQRFWRHPWWLDLEYSARKKPKPKEAKGEWRAYVWPGFVNGRDSFISMPGDWPVDGGEAHDAALTDDPQPYLVVDAWRNPVQPGGTDGEILKAGEGYPKFFVWLGVRAPAPGGEVGSSASLAPFDENRTREIRAMDVVLKIPRIGTRLEYGVADPLVDAQTEFLQTVYLNNYFVSVGGRSLLSAMSKHREPEPQTVEAIYGVLLSDGSDQYDAQKIATVWMVSPPGAGEDAEPDQTWEPYVQHFVFWNVNHATNVLAKASGNRLTLEVPLAGGVGQPLINDLLARVNDMQTEAEEFLRGSVPAGMVWTP